MVVPSSSSLLIFLAEIILVKDLLFTLILLSDLSLSLYFYLYLSPCKKLDMLDILLGVILDTIDLFKLQFYLFNLLIHFCNCSNSSL